MGNIQFGSEVYTWFMQGTGKGYDNKLDHMIKVAAQAGFTGIEPMVLEISESALGCGKYWLGDFCDPIRLKDALQEHNVQLAGLALVCAGAMLAPHIINKLNRLFTDEHPEIDQKRCSRRRTVQGFF